MTQDAQSKDGREHMRRALIMCAETFRFYAKQHRAKGTPDGNEKAVRNDDMAAMCERAFSGVASPVEGTGAWRDIASAPKDGLAERLQARIIEALDRWHDGSRERKATDIVAAIQPLIADALLSAEAENETMRLAICGGEDAPGYAASLPLETILGVLRDNYTSWRRDAELAWDGETATSWRSRALAAEARLAAMVGALKPFAKFRTAGFDSIMLEVVPACPDNPSPRIEPIPLADFQRAAEVYALVSAPPQTEAGKSE